MEYDNIFHEFSLAIEQLKSDIVIKLRKKAHQLGIKNFGRMRKNELQKVIFDALFARLSETDQNYSQEVSAFSEYSQHDEKERACITEDKS